MRVTEEAEFLDVIGTILLATHSRLYCTNGKVVKNWFVMVTLYTETSRLRTQDYAQKPQRNCTFMNSASGL